MKVAFLKTSGMDATGAMTLAEQAKKANSDYDIFCYDRQCKYTKVSMSKNGDFIYYDKLSDIVETINSNYDCLVNIAYPYEDIQEYAEFLSQIKIKKGLIGAMRTSRRNLLAKDFLSKEIAEMYDFVLTLASEESQQFKNMQEFNEKLYSCDFNFFEWDKNKLKNLELNKRKKIIQFAGRFLGFKGFADIVSADNLVNDEFAIVCQGGNFTINKNNRLCASLGLMSLLCIDFPANKELKPNLYAHNSYDEYIEDELTPEYIHLFPAFNRAEKNKRIYKSMFNLFPYAMSKNNIRGVGMWANGLEYTLLESIVFGCPIITSSEYGRTVLVKDKPLIEYDSGVIFIDSFSEIVPKAKNFMENYNKNVTKMQKFFYQNYRNEDKIKKFETIIKNA